MKLIYEISCTCAPASQGSIVHLHELSCITVNFTLFFRAALPSSLETWVLAYEVANYLAN